MTVTKNQRCDECHEQVPYVISIGNAGSNGSWVCVTCLQRAENTIDEFIGNEEDEE